MILWLRLLLINFDFLLDWSVDARVLDLFYTFHKCVKAKIKSVVKRALDLCPAWHLLHVIAKGLISNDQIFELGDGGNAQLCTNFEHLCRARRLIIWTIATRDYLASSYQCRVDRDDGPFSFFYFFRMKTQASFGTGNQSWVNKIEQTK